ncbi:hypothetical protein COU59_00475 [Candidatus Pacearchaeota archaeon CG10_big_fil_rev_8_21_14_0_10_34_12]|nr:MAG: hypothetical protein COU59_00475 [Candidatus Pacearchaeota archaeon CG10_big_fil_rev_8_21_14_0_10_34_12]
MNDKTKSFLGLITILALFVLMSYLVRQNINFFSNLIGENVMGVFVYIFITIVAVVVAPISMVPLIPLASNLWGWIPAGIFTYLGWASGSFIVFYISRKFGVPLIKKFISLKEIYKFESKIPKENLFMDLVLLRMIIPVDILSYALGLFSKVNFKIYSLTTLIGILPFTFIFSYLGTITLKYQIIGFAAVVILVAIMHIIWETKKQS